MERILALTPYYSLVTLQEDEDSFKKRIKGKKTQTQLKPAAHEDTNLIMDCYLYIFRNKSFFLFAFYNIHTVEYNSPFPTITITMP